MLPVSKLRRTCGWSSSSIRASIASAFWVGPLCVSRATVIPISPAVSPIRRRWSITIRRSASSAGCPAPETTTATPNHFPANSDPPLRQLDPLAGPDVGPAHVAAADLHPVQRDVLAEPLRRRVVGLLGDDRRLGDDQPAEVVAPEGQLQVLDPRLADALDGGPDPRGAVAVAEAAQDAFHGSTPIPIPEG